MLSCIAGATAQVLNSLCLFAHHLCHSLSLVLSFILLHNLTPHMFSCHTPDLWHVFWKMNSDFIFNSESQVRDVIDPTELYLD